MITSRPLRWGIATVAMLVTTLGAAQPVRAQLLRYGGEPGDSRTYTRLQHDHVTQTVEGSQQTVDLESYWRFSATVRALGPETVTVDVVHDSVAISGMPADTSPDFSDLYGRRVGIVLGRLGDVREITVPEAASDIERLDLDTTYRTFFPVLPTSPVEPGTSWADTLILNSSQQGLDIKVERIYDYVVPKAVSGPPDTPLRVEFTTMLRLEGSGRQQGADVSLTGTGEGSGAFHFDPLSGTYLGGEETSAVRMDAFVSGGGQDLLIPIVHHRTEKIEILD